MHLSFELAISLQHQSTPQFEMILQLSGNRRDSRIVIGRWGDSLMVLTGDDYSNTRREPKIYAPLENSGHTQFISVVSEPAGTTVFIDGKLSAHNKAVTLKLADKAAASRLVTGNSLRGNSPLNGTLYGLAVYTDGLSSAEIGLHYSAWKESGSFGSLRTGNPYMLYTFDEVSGTGVPEATGKDYYLNLPKRKPVFRTQFLAGFRASDTTLTTVVDILLNFFGFIPASFVLFLLLQRGLNNKSVITLVITVLFAFFLSFAIELRQVWLPTRYSSLPDLILNTLGGGFGGFAAYLTARSQI